MHRFKKKIGIYDFHLCVDKACNVSYFNNEEKIKFDKNDTKRPIWYKEGADPKITCYCNNITEEQTIKVVQEKGITNMIDIIKFIRGKVGSNCKIINPTGECCTQAFNNLII